MNDSHRNSQTITYNDIRVHQNWDENTQGRMERQADINLKVKCTVTVPRQGNRGFNLKSQRWRLEEALMAWSTNPLQPQRPAQFPQGNRAATKTDLHICEHSWDDWILTSQALEQMFWMELSSVLQTTSASCAAACSWQIMELLSGMMTGYLLLM